MKPEYLMKFMRYKYKTLLDKGEWQAPDTQKKQIIALRVELTTMKLKVKGNNISHRQQHEKSKQGILIGKQAKRDNNNNKVKRNYIWQSIKPKGSEPLTLAIYRKTYHWCSEESGTSSGKGCDKWVCHKPIECEG